MQKFSELGLPESLLENLAAIGYETPTPIQGQAIPPLMTGKDLLGIAQTGTGKTAAFSLPILNFLVKDYKETVPKFPRVLILAPTRELASQINENIQSYSKGLKIGSAVIFGGVGQAAQVARIRQGLHILVATPGRLLDLMNQGLLSLEKIEVFVLDEADRMLDMGFLPQINEILRSVPKERQTMLFSATISSEIMRIASANMKFPIRVEIAPTGTTVDSVSQDIFIVAREAKVRLLEKVLAQYSGPTLIFTRTKYGAHRIARAIRQMGFSAAEIHSNLTFPQRKKALDGFKTGEYRVLVATDIMARGIDVIGIELVINYDLPSQAEDYVHRIGRTARAGMKGHAISFVTPSQRGEIRAIEWLIRKKLNVSTIPEFPTMQFAKPRLIYSSKKHWRGKMR